jgi:ubiquitin-conjugating enzyme E2 J2
MATDICTRRLTKELKALRKDPIRDPTMVIMPNEANLLEMHYVIEGSEGTPYAGGIYHGKLLFPKDYPLKPPGVIMLTPTGRFQPGRRLCLSMSDFHPESWNPMWSVSTILTGLYSFMLETAPTLGSMETSSGKKRQLAAHSLEYNVLHDPKFCKLFPEYVERYEEEKKARLIREAASGITAPVSSEPPVHQAVNPGVEMPQGLFATVAGVVAILSIVMAVRFL